MIKRTIVSILCLCLSLCNLSYVNAQDFSLNQLPLPGRILLPSAAFVPIFLKGLVIDPDKPFNFDFIVDSGNGPKDQAFVKEQSQRMIRYFLAALTIPSNDLWVNLSPYEHDRIITNELGQTFLGRDMLAQDYVLKQLTASLIYPEKDLGKAFWSRVYQKVRIKTGRTDFPVNTFNKVWIVPNGAEVLEKGNAVYITKASLKVMLDEDYLSLRRHGSLLAGNNSHTVGNQAIRDIVLPEIEKEVNTGKNFAVLRQIYYAAILAKWYREAVQNTLFSQVYFNKNKIAGIDLHDKTLKEKIYQRYIAAYKKGVFNYIREDRDELTGEIVPRKYFSGGTLMDPAMIHLKLKSISRRNFLDLIVGGFFGVLLTLGSKADGSPQVPEKVAVRQEVKPIDVQRHNLPYIHENYKLARMLYWRLGPPPASNPPYSVRPQLITGDEKTTIVALTPGNPESFYPQHNSLLIAVFGKKDPGPIQAVVDYRDSNNNKKRAIFNLINPTTNKDPKEASRYVLSLPFKDENDTFEITDIRLKIENRTVGVFDRLLTILDVCILIPNISNVPIVPGAPEIPAGTPEQTGEIPNSPTPIGPPQVGLPFSDIFPQGFSFNGGLRPRHHRRPGQSAVTQGPEGVFSPGTEAFLPRPGEEIIVPGSTPSSTPGIGSTPGGPGIGSTPGGPGIGSTPGGPGKSVSEPSSLFILGPAVVAAAAGPKIARWMRKFPKPADADKNGGIDLNQINIDQTGNAVHLSFDAAEIRVLTQVGFKGLAPSIIKIVPISNPIQFFEALTS